MSNDPYPLYDVPWLVRDPNEHYMSAERHQIELFNQTVVDDYFIARSKGIPAREARHVVFVRVADQPRDIVERIRVI